MRKMGIRLMEKFVNDAASSRDQTGITSPAPHIREDELVKEFNRLASLVLAVFGHQSPGSHWRLKNDGSLSIKSMLETFASIDEARLYLDLVI